VLFATLHTIQVSSLVSIGIMIEYDNGIQRIISQVRVELKSECRINDIDHI